MANETVQAVRQAELKAAQIEKDADTKKEALLLEAQQNAKLLISGLLKEAQGKADQRVKEADQKSTVIIENAKRKAEKDIFAMKEIIKNKEQAAIKLVISEVI